MSIMVLYSWHIGGRCIMHSDANIFVILLAQSQNLGGRKTTMMTFLKLLIAWRGNLIETLSSTASLSPN